MNDFTHNSHQSNNPFEISLPSSNLWVFGYGSLMWKPGFRYLQSSPARLYGFNRRLCLWSIHYRGTPERPGLVVGLIPGGSCHGVAFQIDESFREETLQYLYDREMTNYAYRPILKSIYLESRSKVKALTFVSRKDHKQFASLNSDHDIINIIKKAEGPMGTNIDYVINTVAHLKEIGIHDSQLYRIANRLKFT
ncbi:MAG: gamma-glutamylcyclotransferase [Gammaproteobacteria bacterium]|nr:gamma-glutamylcyclotransferase [Gammaproteobacteria bacterium]MCY4274923.1 gamma-glutamylcyclotransferase [Gammaproteobacteria bacterium]